MNKKLYRTCLAISLCIILTLIYLGVDEYYEYNRKLTTPTLQDMTVASETDIIRNDGSYVRNADGNIRMVIPSGEVVGIYVKSTGVMVISAGYLKDEDGRNVSPCCGCLKAGDYIVAVDGETVTGKKDLIDKVKGSSGKVVTLLINRDGEELSFDIKPAKTAKGYMLGVWVKDDISGIGTLTYIDENGFAALGHSINDNDTGKFFAVSDGALYGTSLINIAKPNGNNPGKLEGVIDYSSDNIIGRIEGNTGAGIIGYITKSGAKQLSLDEWMPVAAPNEIHTGKAYIISAISGEREYYEVNIDDVNLSDRNGKNIELSVTDLRLIDLTGGIVQGMSGTPIVQDGKLVGAVTHVLVNDSTKGYGIFIDRMLR